MRWNFCCDGRKADRVSTASFCVAITMVFSPPATRDLRYNRTLGSRFGRQKPVPEGAAMRTIFVTAVAAGLLLCGVAGQQANAAMPMAARPAVRALPIETVTNVCGNNGCVRVQTQRLAKHQKAGNAVPRH